MLNGPSAIQVEFNVKQPAASVLRFYETELPSQGWQVERMGDEMKEDNGEEGIAGSKDGRFVAVVVTPLKNDTSALTLIVK